MNNDTDKSTDVFGVDANGIIITEVSFEKITQQFRPLIKEIVDTIIQTFDDQIASVYLYGSIVTGKAIKGKSDLDSILVLKSKPDEKLLEKISNMAAQLSKKYENLFRSVDLEFTDVIELASEKERFGGMCFVKHLCVCVYGLDIAKDIPGFKPSESVARGFNGDIGQQLDNMRSQIDKAVTGSALKKLSQSTAKKIVRTGFSLVMPRAKSWTSDLQISCNTFAKFYPEKAPEMKTALEWSECGSSDKKSVLDFIDTFGQWLNNEFQHVIPTN